MAEIKEAMPAPQPEALDMPDDEVLYELADLFRVFGDSTRIKILVLRILSLSRFQY